MVRGEEGDGPLVRRSNVQGRENPIAVIMIVLICPRLNCAIYLQFSLHIATRGVGCRTISFTGSYSARKCSNHTGFEILIANIRIHDFSNADKRCLSCTMLSVAQCNYSDVMS